MSESCVHFRPNWYFEIGTDMAGGVSPRQCLMASVVPVYREALAPAILKLNEVLLHLRLSYPLSPLRGGLGTRRLNDALFIQARSLGKERPQGGCLIVAASATSKRGERERGRETERQRERRKQQQMPCCSTSCHTNIRLPVRRAST